MQDHTCDDVLIALRRITRAIDLHSRKLMQTTGLTGPQLLILQMLKRSAVPLSMGELADLVNLSQGTVTSILDRLLKKELVEKVRSTTDKRKVYVSLSAAGGAALERAPTPLQESFIRAFKELHDWEQTLILSSLQRVAQMMNVDHIEVEATLYDQSQGALSGEEHSVLQD